MFSLTFRVRLVGVLTLALVGVGHASPPASALDAYAGAATNATNARRVSHDLNQLRFNTCLERMARKQALLMAATGKMFHQDLGPVQDLCGMGYVGENVAYGYPTGGALVKAWMRSPGHRANILNTHYRLMGIGAVKKNGTWWVAQVFGRKA